MLYEEFKPLFLYQPFYTLQVKLQSDPIIHIIDKSPAYCKIIESCLQGLGYSNFHSYTNSADWLDHGPRPDMVILEHDMGNNQVNGIELLRAFKTRYPATRFIFLTSNSDLDTALSALKSGACDYIVKSKSGLEKLVARVDVLSRQKTEQKRRNVYLHTMVLTLGLFSLLFLTAILVYTHHPV
jgi:DNA-binding NtrC family response regulator